MFCVPGTTPVGLTEIEAFGHICVLGDGLFEVIFATHWLFIANIVVPVVVDTMVNFLVAVVEVVANPVSTFVYTLVFPATAIQFALVVDATKYRPFAGSTDVSAEAQFDVNPNIAIEFVAFASGNLIVAS